MNVIYLWSAFVSLACTDDGSVDDRSLTLKDVPELPAGRYWIKRADTWQYSERVISALHTLDARADVELIDPTGLLGGSRYGTDGNRPTSRPVLAGTKLRTRGPKP